MAGWRLLAHCCSLAALVAGKVLSIDRLRPDGRFPVRPDSPVTFTFAPQASGLNGVSMRRFHFWLRSGSEVILDKQVDSTEPRFEADVAPGRYTWAVQWWSQEGVASAVVQAELVVGPGDDEWQGTPWLGSTTNNEFQAEVNLGGQGVVELRIASLGFGYATVNGAEISQDVLSYSGWTRTDKRVLFRTYDVTHLLNSTMGGNIFVALGCGYRCDAAGSFPSYKDTDVDRSSDSVPKVFRLQLVVNGKVVVFHSGSAGWQMRQGSSIADSVYDGETFSPGKVAPWTAAPALPAGTGPHGAMVAADFPGVQYTRQDTPVSIHKASDGTFVVDFGSNVAGVCSINVPAAATVVLRHGELLQHAHLPDLPTPDPTRVYFGNLRSAKATDTLELTEPVVGWRPRFTYHGFRYVEVQGFPGELTSKDITRLRMNSAVEDRAHAKFGDEVLQAIHEGSKGAQRSNLMQVPTDCPQRDERLGWMGDASLSALSMHLHFDYAAMAGAFVDGIADEMGDDGSLPDVVPFQRYGGRPADLSWSAAFVELLFQSSVQEGTVKRVAAHWPYVRKHMGNLQAQYAQAQQMLPKLNEPYGDWCPPPQKPGDGGTQEHPSHAFVASFSMAQTAAQAAQLAMVVGDVGAPDVKAFQDFADKLKQQFHDTYYDAANHRYDKGTMIANVLALALGAVPPGQQEAVFRTLVSDIAAKNGTFSGGIMNNRHIFDVLHQFGRADLALAMLQRKEYPSYGYMYFNDLEPARECMWELMDAPFEGTGMNSRNHHMFSSVGAYLLKLAGLTYEPTAAHLAATVPALNGALPSAAVSLQTARGAAQLAWRHDAQGEVAVELIVPVGVKATLLVPGVTERALLRRPSGTAVLPGADGIVEMATVDVHGIPHTRLELLSGDYHFVGSASEVSELVI